MKIIITILLFVFTLGAYGQPTAPVLRIETGMHTTVGRRISTDAAGKYLLSSSDDKTARLWDVATGTLLNTFRIPIGSTNEGKIYACSLTPDGKIVALAGYTGYEWDTDLSIYLINTQTGSIIHRIKGLASVINDLEISPDGRWMAAGLGGDNGVRVFETQGWGEYKKLEGYGSDVYNMAFKPGGGLATVCFDGKIRLYNSRFELVAEKSGLAGQKIYSIAFNPAGNLLAVGFDDAGAIEVRDGSDLSLLYKPSVEETENSNVIKMLSFSADGSKLYGVGAFGKYDKERHWKRVVRCWNNEGKGSYNDLPLMKNGLMDIKSIPGGSIAVIGSYPDIAVINSSHKVSWYLSAGNNDYAAADKSHFKVNASGSEIGFTPYLEQAYHFDVSQRKLLQEQSLYPSAVDANAGTTITDWKSHYSPRINGKKILFLDQYEMSICVDISSNGKQIIWGTDRNLYLSDNNTEKIWKTALPSIAMTVNISGNDNVIVAALFDGTIRWYSMADGKELLAFYLHADKKRWVLFTPSGYYDASPGADDFLGWHLNNGPDKAPDFFPVSRFKEKFYRPDVIDAIFETYNEKDAITLANQRSSKKIVATETNIREKLPPTVTINSPANGSNISTNTISINYAIKSPQDAPAKNLRVLIDGRPVATERGLKPVASSVQQKISITVPSQDCIITLLAENDNGTSPETNLYLKWVTPVAIKEEFIYKPKLYVLAIGVSEYNNPQLKLGFAAKDAGDFASAVYKQKGNLYSDVVIKKLTNNEATRDNIMDGLDWIQKQTGQKDLAMIFYAGHGINDNNGIFFMLPVAADLERIRATCLNFEELKQTVSNIAGKVVVFIDACHSGNVMGSTRRGGNDINAVVNELSSTENGAITFTSSTGKEYSLEDVAWGNGAFTKAVIEGLNGKAVMTGKNKITIKSLDAYISERVKEITGGKQHPTSVSPPNVPDFPIAVTQ